MKITVTAVPKPLTKLFPNTWAIADDENCLNYVEKMKEFIFGRETLKIAYDKDIFKNRSTINSAIESPTLKTQPKTAFIKIFQYSDPINSLTALISFFLVFSQLI